MKQRNVIYNLSMKYKFYLISDDIYESMYFNEDARLPPLYYCNDENTKKFNEGEKFLKHDLDFNPYIISLNSFSKIWVPGWRVVRILIKFNLFKIFRE
jgi:DNA-binding transcriptional MocR family regulator